MQKFQPDSRIALQGQLWDGIDSNALARRIICRFSRIFEHTNLSGVIIRNSARGPAKTSNWPTPFIRICVHDLLPDTMVSKWPILLKCSINQSGSRLEGSLSHFLYWYCLARWRITPFFSPGRENPAASIGSGSPPRGSRQPIGR